MTNVLEMLSFLNELQVISDIIEHSENIIFAKDAEKRYTIANNASMKYFGVTKDKIIGKKDKDFLEKEEADFNEKWDDIILSTGVKKSYEKIKKIDDETVIFLVTKDIVKDKLGRVVGISGTVVDITDYKNEQHEIAILREKTNSLIVANKVKYNFIKNLSHNLRTPLMGILGASVMNIEEIDRFGEYKSDLELFKYSAQLLLNIVNEIIEVEPLIYHEIQLLKKPFRIISVARFIEGMYSYICKEQGIKFSCNISKIMNVSVNGDFNRLLQVINKIITFILRFTSVNNSYIDIDFVTEKDDNNENNIQFICKISSNSMITDEIASRMFKSYTDEDEKNILEHSESLGLEMYIATRIVDAFSGILKFESNDHKTFFISIPFIIAKTDLKGIPLDFGDLKVLIADDNKVNQKILKKMVEKMNVHDITIVDDGKKALDAYITAQESQTGQFNLILMDIQMPSMNGIDATLSIRQYENQHKMIPVRILAVTSFITDQDRQECYDAGMNGFLGKPVTQSTLADIIADIYMHPKK